jgi:type I restriction enzyme S subunit
VSELPQGWVEVRVGDVAASLVDGPFGSNLKTEHYTAKGVRVIRLQNIGDGRFDDTDKAFIAEDRFQLLHRHDAQPGDVLIAAMGDVLPRVCMVPPQVGAAIVKADCFRLRPNELVDSKYLMFAMQSPQMRAAAAPQIAGVGRPRLNLRKVRNLPLALAPLAEQKRIVAAIEEAFPRIDAGVAGLGAAQRRLDKMRAAIRFAATRGQLVPQDPADEPAPSLIARVKPTGRFRGTKPLPADLGPIPPGWTWALMGALAQRVTVGHVGPMKDEYVADGFPFLRSQNVREDRFDPAGLRYISPEFHARLGKSRLLPGDVVIVRSGNVGTACVVPDSLGEANCADLVIVQRPEAVDPYYVALYMNSLARSRVSEGRVGVALTHFNTQSVAELPVPVPPFNEQKRIVAEAQRLMSTVDALEADIGGGLKKAKACRSSILTSAFSGNLTSHNTDDEPASILLERIASERAESPGRRSATRSRKTLTVPRR